MKLSLHWRSLLEGAGPAGRAALKEFEGAYSVIAKWTSREHDNEGKHLDVTATSVIITSITDLALRALVGLTDLGAAFALSGAITPPTITAATNNYSPVGIEKAFLLRLTTDLSWQITGIKDGPRLVPQAGRMLLLFNAGSSNVVLFHEDTGSDENFRFRLPGFLNLIIPPNNASLITYDAKSRRWITLAGTSGVGSSSSEYNAGDSGAAITIQWANGPQQILTLTDNAAITLLGGVPGTEYRLLMIEGGPGGWQPTFDGSVVFENDTLDPARQAPGDVLKLHLIRTEIDGGVYLAQYTSDEAPPTFDFDGSSPLTTKGDLIVRDASAAVRLAVGADGTILTAHAAASEGVAWLPPVRRRRNVEFKLGGLGTVIPSGVGGFVHMPCSGLIVGATVLSTDPAVLTGSIVLDVWKDSYANFPPTVADTITASAKPTITGAKKAQDTTLTGWTKTVVPNDVIGVNVDSVSTFTSASLFLTIEEDA